MSYNETKNHFVKTCKEDIDRVQELVKDIKSGSYTTRGEKVIIDRYPDGDLQITCIYDYGDTCYFLTICEDGEIFPNYGKLSWMPCRTEQEMCDCLSSVVWSSTRLHEKLNKKEFTPLLDRFILLVKENIA